VSPDKGQPKKKPKRSTPSLRVREEGSFVPPYKVVWHPGADAELRLAPVADQVAMLHAAQKLAAEGPNLRFPHQSAVRGDEGKGLRELRPRSGRSVWRPLYRRVADIYMIVAIGPEADVDPAGFAAAGTRGNERLAALEDD
jgi:Phage derived protein Gp49-like (DUF891)